MIEQAIYSILTSNSAVSNLIGTRVFPEFIPQNESIPAVTYTQIAGSRERDSGGAKGWVQGLFQVNCWDDVYADMDDLTKKVRIALDDFTGTSGGTQIDVISVLDEANIARISPGVDKLRRYGKRLDVNIWYREDLTT